MNHALVAELRNEVADELAGIDLLDDGARRALSVDDRRLLGQDLIRQVVERHVTRRMRAGEAALSEPEEDDLVQAIEDATFGLGVLEVLLADDQIEQINANGCDQVFIIRQDGFKSPAPSIAGSDAEMVEIIRRAVSSGSLNRRFDESHPHVNAVLPDGSRLFGAMAITHRPVLSIRRHRVSDPDLAEMLSLGTIDIALESFLGAAVGARCNMIVSGATFAGKTTLLRALANEIDPLERLVVIEDEAELQLASNAKRHPDVVAMETRAANIEGEGEIGMAELVRHSLRMAPQRVLVGEVRGAEAIPMLLAMSQGTEGSMCTIHADSSQNVFSRLALYTTMAPEKLPKDATNQLIAESLDFVVHLARNPQGQRFVTSIREVTGAEGDMVSSNELWAPGHDRRAVPSAPMTDVRRERLMGAGFDPSLLDRRDGWWS